MVVLCVFDVHLYFKTWDKKKRQKRTISETKSPSHQKESQNKSTTIIIGDLWNTELDTLWLLPKYAQMVYAEAEPLVSPDSRCLGLGLYAELFLFSALRRLQRWWRKRVFWGKKISKLSVYIMLFRGKKAMSQIFSCVIYCKIKHSNCESNQAGEQCNHTRFPIK